MVYQSVIGLDFKQLLEQFRDMMSDQNLCISSSHWTTEKRQIFLLRLSQKRCLSRRKWEEILKFGEYKPSLITY